MRAMPVTATPRRLAGRVWTGVAALVFSGATAATIAICISMASKGGVPMAGGWTMSMAWARMCGQTWAGAAAAFVGMWTAMTVAMMLPVLAPALRRSHEAAAGRGRVSSATWVLLAGAGYFAVWIGVGVVLYPAGAALADLAWRMPAFARAVPWASGVALLMAGWYQASAVKMRYLACCRAAASCAPAAQAGARAALCHGVRLGLHCSGCCAGFTVMLLAVGVMDLRAMACAAAAIFAERFARDGERVARFTGLLIAAAGLAMIAQWGGWAV
jgi:predicted metal-binding membrane protein